MLSGRLALLLPPAHEFDNLTGDDPSALRIGDIHGIVFLSHHETGEDYLGLSPSRLLGNFAELLVNNQNHFMPLRAPHPSHERIQIAVPPHSSQRDP